MLDRFARFSLVISEIDRCWHKLAAGEMSKYELNSPMRFTLPRSTIMLTASLPPSWERVFIIRKLIEYSKPK